MLDYTKIRFWWSGLAGRKVSSGRYDKIYDMGPRAATGDATFATAATRPIVDELSDWYGLAVDPAATNLVTWSEDFTQATWAKTVSASVTGNTGVAPDGTTTADTFTAGANGSQIQLVIAGTSGIAYTASFWVRRVTGSGVVNIRAVENVNTPIAVTSSWQRVSLSAVSTTTTIRIGLALSTSGDAVEIWGAQLETGSVATQYKKTTGTAVTTSALVAPIPDAIPVTGTIIMWDNMVNGYNGMNRNRIIDSEDLSTTFLSIIKSYTNTNRTSVRVHSNTDIESADLLWQPTNQRKRWFFAMTYNGSTVQLYRGDVQGNISKVIDSVYTPTTAVIRDLYLHSTATGATQVGASFLDILTYDDVMTQSDIEAIFYGSIPVFQQTGYAGTFVDKFRQKVQAEPGSTYVTTLEATVLADWSEEL